MIGTDLSIGEGARRERRLHSVCRGRGLRWGRSAPAGRLLRSDAHHDEIPIVHRGTSGAPHSPQGGGRGDTGRGLPVKLDEGGHQCVGVPQGQMSQLGVRPREVYVHYDRVAGLTLLVLKWAPVRLRLRVRHTGGDDFIFGPLDVTPVQLLLNVLVLFL